MEEREGANNNSETLDFLKLDSVPFNRSERRIAGVKTIPEKNHKSFVFALKVILTALN